MKSSKLEKVLPFKQSKKSSLKQREQAAESICPTPRCQGNLVYGHRCANCGAVKSVNAVSGNVVWMKNGRIVQGGAFRDERDAFTSMALQYNVPVEEWPERFRP